MRSPIAPFLAADVPTSAVAGTGLRFAYASAFSLQVVLALAVGALAVWLAPRTASPHDLMAGVLLAMAVLHLPLGLLLSWAVGRSPGKGPALVAALTAAVVLSVPAWFAVLLTVSAQRAPYVVTTWAVLALGYAAGLLLSPRWIQGAITPVEPTEPDGGRT
jgi:hypothetical protein